MEFVKHIFSRGLPKTGQVTEYVAGDDGTYEAGWWVKRLNANNRTRFVVKDIGGDVVVYDRATGLCWAADSNEAGCNNGASLSLDNALTYVTTLNFAGFIDWRVPNIRELLSIINYIEISPCIKEPPFINTKTDYYLTSTTNIGNTIYGWLLTFDTGLIASDLKTNSHYLRCVRGGV